MREGEVYCIDYDELYREVDWGRGIIYRGCTGCTKMHYYRWRVMDGLAAMARTMFNV